MLENISGLRIKYENTYQDGSKMVGANIRFNPDAAAFFEILKGGYLQWRARHGDGKHKVLISAVVPEKSETYRAFILTLIDLWNSDNALDALTPISVEFSLRCGSDSWLGGTTDLIPLETNPIRWMPCQRKMQLLDYEMQLLDHEEKIKANEERLRQFEIDEAARRLANPVRNPVRLPWNIKSKIASYLRLEYGESWWSRDSIKSRDLTFECEVTVNGVPTQYWRYPTSRPDEPMWAIVERFDDTYHIGMTGERPPVHGS